MMGGGKLEFLKAVGLGAVSYLALTVGSAEWAVAQGPASIELETITVQGQEENAWGPVSGYVATRSATGTKSDTPLVETPQSISVVTRDQMDAQAATSIGEALRYTAGVVSGTPGLQSRRSDSIFFRGFGGFGSAANYVSYLDGLKWHYPLRTAVQIDPWMVERVEVFKGPSSVLYGQANPGGFVNLVSKRPSATPGGEIFVRGGSHGHLEGGFDITGPVARDPRFLYRVVGLGRLADSQIDFQEEQRQFIAPSFTFAPTADTKLTVSALYQRDPKAIDSGFLPIIGTALPSGYGKLPPNRFQGDPQWNLFDRTQKAIGYQFEHRFNDLFMFRQNFRYGRLESDSRGVDLSSLQPNNRLLNRTVGHHVHHADSFSLDNQLQARFETGPLRHTVLFGLDYQYMDSIWQSGSGSIGTIDMYAPVYGQSFVFPALVNRRHDQLRQIGIYAQDQIELGNWRLLLSGRKDFARTSNNIFNTVSNRVTSASYTDDAAFTGRAGLLYLFENGLAPYVSYSTSFEPQAGSDASGNAFEPTKGRQFEAGIKFQPSGWNSYVTAAAYHLIRENVLTTDTSNPLYSVQNGEVRSRGIEIEAKASLAEGFDVTAAYTFTDVEVTKSNNTVALIDGSGSVSLQGTVPVAVPRHTASLWASYRFGQGPLAGFVVGGGVRYIGETYGTTANVWNVTNFVRTPAKVPGFTLVDAAVSYDFQYAHPSLKGVTASANVRNLFDKDYLAACNGYGACMYGESRTVLATLSYRW